MDSNKTHLDSGEEPLTDPITLQDFRTFMYVYPVIFTAVSILGSVSNCINSMVFAKMGLRDPITQTFFSLSVADLGVSASAALNGVSIGFSVIERELGVVFPLNPTIPMGYTTNVMTSFVAASILLTTFLAVQRCCCVALPFTYKHIFSKRVTLTVISAISCVFVFLTLSYASALSVDWTIVQRDGVNVTRLQFVPNPHRDVLVNYLVMIHLFLMTIGCEIIVVVCLVVMIAGLKKSERFRSQSVCSDTTRGDSTKTRTIGGLKTPGLSSRNAKQQTSDVKVLNTVILISAVFVVCNSVAVVNAMLQMFFADFYTYAGSLQRSRRVAYLVMNFFHVVNSVCNTFIYYKSNSKFRATLKAKKSI